MSTNIATVPYSKNKSVDFYNDKIIFDSKEIDYEDIVGYSYQITHTNTSVYLIPVANSTAFSIQFFVGRKRPIVFSQTAESAFLRRGDKQDTVQLVFSELVKCVNVLISPYVLQKCLDIISEGGEIIIGPLIITRDSIMKKQMFGRKEMVQYGRTTFSNGFVSVEEPDGTSFCMVPLSTMNAPLIIEILHKLFEE